MVAIAWRTVGAPLNGEGHLAQSDGTDRPVADGTLLHVLLLVVGRRRRRQCTGAGLFVYYPTTWNAIR